MLKIGAGYSLARAGLLLAICSLITLYGCFRNPYTPFYCFAGLAPMFSAMGTTVALVLGGTVSILINRKQCGWAWKFSPAGTVFCLWTIASLAWGQTFYLADDSFLIQILPAMIFAIVISGIRDPIFRRNIILMLILPCVLGSVASFRNWLTGRIPEYGYGRVYGLIAPDIFSAWLLCGILGALAWTLAGRLPALVKIILGLCLPVMLLGVGLCGFRAAILAAALGIIVISIRKKPLANGFAVFCVAVVTVSLIYAADPGMFERVINRFHAMGEDRGSGRFDIWNAGLLAFAQSPIIGLGIDNFRFAVIRYLGDDWAAHSIYVGTLVELGVIGFALLVAWIFCLIRKAWHAQDSLLLLPLLIVYLFQGAFLHEFQFGCFWLAIGLIEGSTPKAIQTINRSLRTTSRRTFHGIYPAAKARTHYARNDQRGNRACVAVFRIRTDH